VAGALAALAVFPQRFLYSMGIGGALVALAAALISLTVLPAILALLGDRVNSLSPKFLQRRAEADSRPATEGFWYRLSRTVMRVPGRIALASATFLIVLGIPFFSINFTSVDAQVLPEETSARMVDNELRSEFPPFRDSPVQVYAEGSEAEVNSLADEAARLDGVAEVVPPLKLDGDAWAIEVVSVNPPLDEQSQDLVASIRDIDESSLVTGFTANFVDLQDSLAEHLPLVLLIVGLVTVVVLFLMTGSVILPIKQLIMNLLGLSAVFGILVFIFQDGRLEGVLDFTSPMAIDVSVPILLFAVVFGLSTDYGVFLLHRIRQEREAGAGDSAAIARGLVRSGRSISAAALLFAVAMGAFVFSDLVSIKEVALGTAVAVLIDATLVRAFLFPALISLLGSWAWWAPRWLSGAPRA
jgi:RND superfamily putative drug exporter